MLNEASERIAVAVKRVAAAQGLNCARLGEMLTHRKPSGVSKEFVRQLLNEKAHLMSTGDIEAWVRLLGPALLQELANAWGVEATVLHTATPAPVSPTRAIADAQVAAARAMVAHAEAHADGIVTPSEAVEVRAKCRDACQAFHAAAQVAA